MYHYVYLITFPSSKKYVGVHSTTILPELDHAYLGSGSALPTDRTIHTCTKTILKEFTDRGAAVNYETAYIVEHGCIKSNDYLNKRLGNYDKHGQTKNLCKGIAVTASKLKGRTVETHDYVKKVAHKNSLNSGKNRSAASKYADSNGRKYLNLGCKNPNKGHPSTSNCAFVPWYFITPSGERTDVWDKTKKEYLDIFNVTRRQLGFRFSQENIGKPAKRGPLKGWIFGNI